MGGVLQKLRLEHVLLFGIIALAFLVRVYPLEAYHGWDESSYLQYAEHIAFGKNNYGEFSYRPPMVPLLLSGIFLLWHSPYAASLLVAALSALVSVGAYFLGKRIFSPGAGIFAALLLALHPVFIVTGHLILSDAIAASFLSLGFALLLSSHARYWIVGGIFVGCAALTKFTCFVILVPMTALLFWRERRFFGPLVWSYIGGVSLVVAPYLLWCWKTYGDVLKPLRDAGTLLPKSGPPWWFYATDPVLTVPLLIGIFSFLILLVTRKRKHLDQFAMVTLGVWFLAIAIPLLMLAHKEPRFFLPALVPIAIFAGIGWDVLFRTGAQWMEKRSVNNKIILLGAGIILGLFFIASATPEIYRLHEPIRNYWVPPAVEAAEAILAHGNTSAPIYTTTDYPVFGYYTNNRIIVIDGPRFDDAYPRIMPRPGYLVVAADRTLSPTIAWADQQEELTPVLHNEYMNVYWYVPPHLLR